MAHLLYSAWRYGGEPPWRTYNGTDAPSPLPVRYRLFLMGCGSYAAEEARDFAVVSGQGDLNKVKAADAQARKKAEARRKRQKLAAGKKK